MKIIGILLILIGLIGILMSTIMFGDIGIACFIGAITALLSGFGFISLSKQLKQIKHKGET